VRVGILVHGLQGGGAEVVARLWATGLTDRGHHVTFLLYGSPASRERVVDEPVVVFPGRSVASRWTGLPRWVRREVERLDVDVVLSVLDFSNIAALLATFGSPRPVVISEHATPSLLWRHRGAGGAAKKLAARLLYRRAAATIAVSHAVAADLRVTLSVPPERIVVLPNPVVTPTGTGLQRGGAADAGAGHRLLVVGRCASEKRVDRAIEVLGELRKRGHDWTACVIGDGPLRPALKRLAQQEQLPVKFPGWVIPWQAEARPGDVLLMTSDLEGFGNVLVEAAAAGIPTVAPSPALGVADAVLPDLTGVLSPTSRVEDLADAVLRAAELRLGTPGVQTWLERFHPEAVAERLEAVLERTVRSDHVVTQVGPAPDAQGGMASVLRTYRDAGVEGWRMRFLTSYVSGRRLWNAGPAARVLLALVLSPASSLGVVHVHISDSGSFVREGGLAVVAALRGPVVVTVHGSDFAQFYRKHRSLVLLVLRRADEVILLSEAHRAMLPADLRKRAVLVPNTVTITHEEPTAPPTTPQALFAGEVGRRKGVDVLLAAWPMVRSAVHGAELVIAGPPGDVIPVDQPGVRFVGALNNAEVRAMLQRSRVAVLPSRREAMPMFVLEAMSARRVVVGTPVGAVAETVGEGGRIVPVGDVDALAEALSQLLAADGRAEEMGFAARKRFEERFAPERGLRRLRGVYEDARRRRFTAAVPGLRDATRA